MKPFALVRSQWDRSLAVVLVVAGVVALMLGWYGASNTEYVAKQIPYVISGGLAAVVLCGVGVGLWISADLCDEWRVIRALAVQIEIDRGAAHPSPAGSVAADLQSAVELTQHRRADSPSVRTR